MEQFAKDTYKTFSEMLTEEEFNKLFNSLEKGNRKDFGRASLMYQRAIRCKSCDSDVCIALLCSAVEALSGGKNIIFKDWLLSNKLGEFAKKPEAQVRKSLNRAFEEYLQSERLREGIAYNFRTFLVEYCPHELRNPPIKVYKGKGNPFDIALRGLYSRFRSFFLHEGIGYAGIADKPYIDEETGEAIRMIAIPLLTKVDRRYVSFELTELTDWFAKVVKTSLLQYLRKQT